MKSRPIPIEELKSGEFYDIQSSDENPRVLGALLLEQLPNTRVKLLFMSASGFDRFKVFDTEIVLVKRSLQIETIQLDTVYPYQAFAHQPTTILQWPQQYEGQELISQISEEMRRTAREGRWVFNLPHFLDGYLHIYLSYIRSRDNSIRRTDLVDLWFDFMGSYFSVLRDHILRVKLLPRETISYLLKALKGMDQMSQQSWQLSDIIPNSSSIEKEENLANRKNSFFDSYRPRVLSSGVFDQFWQFLLQEYHQDLITWRRQEPLSLGNLLINSPKLTELLNSYRYFLKDLLAANFPELYPQESVRLKLRIAAASNSFNLAEIILTESKITPEVISLIILEEELLDSILRSSSDRMKTFVMTRTEFFPSVSTYLNITHIPDVQLFCAFQCLTARITLKDWESISFVTEKVIVAGLYNFLYKNPVPTYPLIRRLLEVSLQHTMRPELLRNLLPCEIYGHLVFSTLIEMSSYPNCRNVMVAYFRPEAWHDDVNNPRAKERIFSFLNNLTARIALEDWEFIHFVIENEALRPAAWHSLLGNNELYKNVNELVSVAFEHNMSVILLKDLLPCKDYGNLVFPALIELSSHPNCRDAMITYFRQEKWHPDIYNPQTEQRFLTLFTMLTVRIALEDWNFVTFIAENQILRPKKQHNYLRSLEAFENVKALLIVALEHNMSAELLQGLLLCDEYGPLVFAALAKVFLRSRCFRVMVSYFGSEGKCIDTAREMVLTYFPSDGQLPKKVGQKNLRVRNTELSCYLQSEKLDLWYMFGGSVLIQFIWIKQFSQGFLKKLSPPLVREVCSYLV